jgi:hypothetical protein
MRPPAGLAILPGGFSAFSFAQSTAFTGFTSSNLALTGSVYAGTASTAIVGQALPPVCATTVAKSEMAIDLSSDGTALTMAGYVAPVDAIDVSNADTPGAYDPANPAGGSYYRLPSSNREYPL